MPESTLLASFIKKEAHAQAAAQLLRSMANPHRLMLLCALVEGEKSVGALNELVPLSQSALSQHLAILREEQLVETRRESQSIFYRLTPGPIEALLDVLHRNFCDQDFAE